MSAAMTMNEARLIGACAVEGIARSFRKEAEKHITCGEVADILFKIAAEIKDRATHDPQITSNGT